MTNITEKSLKNGQLTLVHADSLQYIKSLPDSSLDCIVTDPPYYQVKSNGWDNQWDSAEEFLAWLDEFFAEFWRVLKPSGCLYVFCGPYLSADTEILMRDRFSVLNHIIWAKPHGRWKGTRKEDLRKFFPATERILFAEHYGAEGFAKGNSGYATKCRELKQQVFTPLIEYFKTARESLGISAKEINAATGTQMCSHWFSKSQWKLPTAEQYAALQQLFADKAGQLGRSHADLVKEHGELNLEYQTLLRQYDDLKVEYANLRRPFTVTKEVPYTDVWDFAPVPWYPGKHPCEKPADLMEHIISSSTRPGDVVADFFMGSGAAGKACAKLGRGFVGVELEEETYQQTADSFETL